MVHDLRSSCAGWKCAGQDWFTCGTRRCSSWALVSPDGWCYCKVACFYSMVGVPCTCKPRARHGWDEGRTALCFPLMYLYFRLGYQTHFKFSSIWTYALGTYYGPGFSMECEILSGSLWTSPKDYIHLECFLVSKYLEYDGAYVREISSS